MLHGAQRGLFELLFRVPAECADMVIAGQADIGIIPSFELLGRDLATVAGVGIACHGDVRSILLISKVPAREIQSLAADVSSRTSVALTRIILDRRYGTRPAVVRQSPDLKRMLEVSDAALIIGDPALRLDVGTLPFHVYDLGREWLELTGLPMVFALWAGGAGRITPAVTAAFQGSCAFGIRHLEQIISEEAAARGFAPELVHQYLTSHIRFELGAGEERGMQVFLQYARELAAPAGLTAPAAL